MRLELPKLDPLSRACLHYAARFVRGTDDIQVHPSGTSLVVDGMYQSPSPLILMLAEAARRAVRDGATHEVFGECVEELRARQVGKKEIKWLRRLHDDLLAGMDELKALAAEYSVTSSGNSNVVSGEI